MDTDKIYWHPVILPTLQLEIENQTLEQVLDELGITARVEKRGKEQGASSKARHFCQALK